MKREKSWLPPALAGLVCFGAMFLCFAELARRSVSIDVTFAVCFGVAWLLFLAERRVKGARAASWKRHGRWIAAAAVLCAVANAVALAAVEVAPNPGYAVALFGLQGMFLTIFKGRRDLAENAGVTSLVVGAGIIAAFGAPSAAQAAGGWQWVALSVTAALLFACEYGTFSAVVRRLEAEREPHYLAVAREAIWLPTTAIFLVACLARSALPLPDMSAAALLVVSGLLSWAGNIASFKAISRVTNPGLPLAVFAAQSMFVALLSVPLFRSELRPAVMGGMALCVLGIFLLHVAPGRAAAVQDVAGT